MLYNEQVNRKRFLITYKVGFALLALIAMIAQLANGLENQDFNTVNFFSYFTVESNLFAVVIFLMSAQAIATKRQDKELESLRGAATFYMLTTGVIYNLFLTGVGVHTPLPWVNFVLHNLFPLVVLLDWLYDRPRRTFEPKSSLIWLSFPLVYAVYTLVRGHFTHWYPYPFIDVAKHGYGTVILNCLLLALGMIAGAVIVGKLPAAIPKRPAKK